MVYILNQYENHRKVAILIAEHRIDESNSKFPLSLNAKCKENGNRGKKTSTPDRCERLTRISSCGNQKTHVSWANGNYEISFLERLLLYHNRWRQFCLSYWKFLICLTHCLCSSFKFVRSAGFVSLIPKEE